LAQSEELAAEDLRAAAYALGRLLGRVDVEDILGVIFQQFCIGK
jgi:tRNA modification GTPase